LSDKGIFLKGELMTAFLSGLSETFLFIMKSMPFLMKGIIVALEVTILSIILGMVVGLLVAFLKIYGSPPVKKIVKVYEWVMKGLPILVLLFLIYFGLPSLGIHIGAFLSVVLALGLGSSAYQAQIYRGAFLSIGQEQMEAGLSLGMSKFKTLYYVIIPQAVRLSLPGFTNEFTIVLKDSPLAYAVGIAEILKNGRDIISTSYRPFEIYFACSIIYFVLFQFFFWLFKKVANRYSVPGYSLDF